LTAGELPHPIGALTAFLFGRLYFRLAKQFVKDVVWDRVGHVTGAAADK
jgi:hypothetical protein